jgi:hypothetical protein
VRNASSRIEDAGEPVGELSDGTEISSRFTEEALAERVEKLGEEVVANLRTSGPAEAPACADD